MITDEQMEKAFNCTNFGPGGDTMEGKKKMVAMAVMKLVAGYRTGHTMACILTELKMTTKNYGMPKKKARRWAYDELFTQQMKSQAP